MTGGAIGSPDCFRPKPSVAGCGWTRGRPWKMSGRRERGTESFCRARQYLPAPTQGRIVPENPAPVERRGLLRGRPPSHAQGEQGHRVNFLELRRLALTQLPLPVRRSNCFCRCCCRSGSRSAWRLQPRPGPWMGAQPPVTERRRA